MLKHTANVTQRSLTGAKTALLYFETVVLTIYDTLKDVVLASRLQNTLSPVRAIVRSPLSGP